MSGSETPLDHVLVVHEHPVDGLDIEHPPDCPFEYEDTPIGPVRWWKCAVESLAEHIGCYFRHAADTTHKVDGEDAEDNGTERLQPGRYPLGAWFSEQPGGPWGPTEYDAGLVRGERL